MNLEYGFMWIIINIFLKIVNMMRILHY